MEIHICVTLFVNFIQNPSHVVLGETCGSENKCDAGLYCSTCPANGNTRSRCTRTQPRNPTSKV
ncbi:hypothetical protein CR513_15708, partial [Mucuna pruriens]